MGKRSLRLCLVAVCLLAAAAGCAEPLERDPAFPSVAPGRQPAALLQLGGAQIRPMYREMLAVDLPTVARVAMDRSIDIRQARARVEASRGRYEGSVEAIFPVIAPAFTYQHLEGANQNANGSLVITNFNNLLPAITLQWIVNPGRIYYDIVASKRRLQASGHQAKATELDVVRIAAVQYYDLVLAQARVGVAQKSAAEAEEALRLADLQVKAGTGLPADQMRARAFLAGRRQDLLLAVNAFYQSSLALTGTLQLDPVVTLAPGPTEIAQTTLVREDLDIDALLGMAVQYRPDLKAARTLLAAAEADRGAVVWGALGPQLQAAYTYGGLGTRGRFENTGIHEQQRGSAGAGFALGLSTFGNVKTASATLRISALDVERRLQDVRTQVIGAQQMSLTTAALIPIAQEQVQAAEEALRLAQANQREGTLLLLDVLQAEDQVDSARLRYADAVAHYNQSQVNLIAALGLLQARILTPASAPTTTTTSPTSTAPSSSE